MARREQKLASPQRPMSMFLWNSFTGSATYKKNSLGFNSSMLCAALYLGIDQSHVSAQTYTGGGVNIVLIEGGGCKRFG